MRNAADLLPPSLPPRGLSRSEAAAYIGVSPSLFDAMVKDGRMPQPKRINSRTIWDRARLDEAFEALPGGDSNNPWDDGGTDGQDSTSVCR
jgi:predicted DNA-binding transcriptional regulator AlpA